MDTLYIILFHIKSNTKDDVIIKLIRIFRTHKKVKPTFTHMKMILFRLICLKTCLLLIPVLYAQNNYRPGFIITVQKDTIYGEIDNWVGDDHRITAEIDGVKAIVDICSSTSAIAGWSVVALLRNLASPVVFY